jgi:cobalt-zinc-cadmium efflux system protein
MHAAHGHSHDTHGRLQTTGGNRTRVLIAAVLTCGFMIAEVVGGLLTGSLALLADAGHMLTDSVSLVLAYVAYRLSERPGTSQMTYGFDRLKILVAYTNGLTVLGIALWITIEAVERFLSPTPILGGAMFVVAVIGLVVNIVVLLVLRGGDRESLNLRGAILHVLGDLLGSVAAIAAAVIILFTGWFPADPLLSVLVALLLVRSAWKLLRDSGLILLEAAPGHIERNEVAEDLAGNVEGIADVHHMHLWSLDGRQLLATLHATLSKGANPETAIGAIKRRLSHVHGIDHATVEVETGERCSEDAGRRRSDGTARR